MNLKQKVQKTKLPKIHSPNRAKYNQFKTESSSIDYKSVNWLKRDKWRWCDKTESHRLIFCGYDPIVGYMIPIIFIRIATCLNCTGVMLKCNVY